MSDWEVTIKSFTGKLGSTIYPDVDEGAKEGEPWFLSMHKGLGSMLEEGLPIASGVQASPANGVSEGKKGLATKRQKVKVSASGPKETATLDDSGDEVAV